MYTELDVVKNFLNYYALLSEDEKMSFFAAFVACATRRIDPDETQKILINLKAGMKWLRFDVSTSINREEVKSDMQELIR